LAGLALLLGAGALGRAAWLDGPWRFRGPPGGRTSPPPAGLDGARDPRPAGSRPPAFLLVVADGLREDAVGRMPTLSALALQGASGVAITGEPTMSATCIRSILTGRSPDVWSAFRNAAALPTGGTLVEALVARGARAGHAGDAVIPRLCGDAFDPRDVFQLPRVAFRDVGGLDRVTFPEAVRRAADDALDVLTVHLVTVDLTGHASGADSAAYREACAELDDRLWAIVGAFRARRPGATVLVAADHGLSPRGTHGGGEPEARRAPFVLVGPRVARVRGVTLAQTALAPTVAALLELPSPPLAESPPALELTVISDVEKAAALEGWLRGRAAAARDVGDDAGARDLESRLASAPRVPIEARLDALLTMACVDPPAPARSRGIVLGVLALGLAFAAAAVPFVRAGEPCGTTRVALAGLASLAVALAAARVVYEAWRSAAVPGAVALRAFGVGLGLLCVGLAALLGPGGPTRLVGWLRRRTSAALLLFGGAVGLLLASRLAVDGAIHTPLLTATLATLAVVVGVAAPRAWSSRGLVGAIVLGLVAIALFVPRLLDALLGEGRAASVVPGRVADLATAAIVVGTGALALRLRATRGERRLVAGFAVATWLHRLFVGAGDLSTVLFAVLAAAAILASRLPAPRTRGGVAGLAAALLLLRVAQGHALGLLESLADLDPTGTWFPGASGIETSPSADGIRFGALRWGRQALLWAVLLAPAIHALRRDQGPGPSRLLFDLGAGLLGATSAVVLGVAVWGPWAWWTVVAIPTFVSGLGDVLVLVGAAWLVPQRPELTRAAPPDGGLPGPAAG